MKPYKLKPITGDDETSEINTAISLPDDFESNDGRLFQILDWKAHVPIGGLVEVTARMCVLITDENAPSVGPEEKA